MTMGENGRHKQMIQAVLDERGWTDATWRQNEEEGRDEAVVGRFRALDDSDYDFASEAGELSAVVLGSAELGNERVAFLFMEDGTDSPDEVHPGDLERIY